MSQKMKYSAPGVPRAYKCGKCGATGCKLWREYQTVAPKLLCAPCAAANQNRDISGIDGRGAMPDGSRRDRSIGWYVPAIPDEEGVGYWGYTSVPQIGIEWWERLPTLPGQSLEYPAPAK